MNFDQQTNDETYRLIVTRRNASEILLLPAAGSGSRLPRVEIPRGQRIAEQLTAKLYAQHGCRGYCLLVPTLVAGLPRCAVMEVVDLDETPSARNGWMPLDATTCRSIDSAEDRLVTQKSIEELDVYRREPLQAPFARPGWLSELFAWTEERLNPLCIRLTGAFTQLNASPAFSLMRLETNDSAVWFKATGSPNRHELPITACIAHLFPGYVPELLGVHPAWNGWLMRDVAGTTLGYGTELSSWPKAAESLARLQILSIGNKAALLESQCKDLRLPRLVEQIDPFIDRMRELMAAQEKLLPRALTISELALVQDRVWEAARHLERLELPDTIGHGDFNPGNIVVCPERCVFLDWAEGCVTFPFLTFEYLREHFLRGGGRATAVVEGITDAYLRPWKSLLSRHDLTRAAEVSPLIAVFAYAVADRRWSASDPLQNPRHARLRSLTRRMYSEVTKLAKGRNHAGSELNSSVFSGRACH